MFISKTLKLFALNVPFKLLLTAICIITFFSGQSQRKIVILGSSTAFGIGATPISNSWANLYTAYQKTASPVTTVVNLAVPGFVTYQILPTGTIPPAGRPGPESKNNITAALAENPSAIIISLTSNDAANYYNITETENNFITVYNIAKAAGIPAYVTTTAPRNLDANQKNLQTLTKDWILNYFGSNAIDFWTTLANADGSVKPEYQYEDDIHFNNAGHSILFEKVKAKKILSEVTLGIKFGNIKAFPKQDGIQLEWNVLEEKNIEKFEVLRSSNGLDFLKVADVLAANTGIAANYYWFDNNKFSKIFYKIAAIEKSGDKEVSNIVTVNSGTEVREFSIYPNPLTGKFITIHCKNLEPGDYSLQITTQSGQQQVKEFKIAMSASTINLKIPENMGGGLYYLQLKGMGFSGVKSVVKN